MPVARPVAELPRRLAPGPSSRHAAGGSHQRVRAREFQCRRSADVGAEIAPSTAAWLGVHRTLVERQAQRLAGRSRTARAARWFHRECPRAKKAGFWCGDQAWRWISARVLTKQPVEPDLQPCGSGGRRAALFGEGGGDSVTRSRCRDVPAHAHLALVDPGACAQAGDSVCSRARSRASTAAWAASLRRSVSRMEPTASRDRGRPILELLLVGRCFAAQRLLGLTVRAAASPDRAGCAQRRPDATARASSSPNRHWRRRLPCREAPPPLRRASLPERALSSASAAGLVRSSTRARGRSTSLAALLPGPRWRLRAAALGAVAWQNRIS